MSFFFFNNKRNVQDFRNFIITKKDSFQHFYFNILFFVGTATILTQLPYENVGGGLKQLCSFQLDPLNKVIFFFFLAGFINFVFSTFLLNIFFVHVVS